MNCLYRLTQLITLYLVVSFTTIGIAFASTDAVVGAKQMADAAEAGATNVEQSGAWTLLESLKENAALPWSGIAQGLAYKKNDLGLPDYSQGEQFNSKNWQKFPANMTFQIQVDENGNSHLYYLSAISDTYDKQIDLDAKGLCQNARPREVIAKWNPGLGDYMLYVQLTKFVGPAEGLTAEQIEALPAAQKSQLPYVLYTVPLSKVEQNSPQELSFNSFLTMPKVYQDQINDIENPGLSPNDPNYDDKAYEKYITVVNYDMLQTENKKNTALGNSLADCLIEKPWEQFNFLSDSDVAKLQAQ